MARQLTLVAPDADAADIGQLYALARSSLIGSMKDCIECGKRLKAKKATLKHGEWLPWLEANKEVLGFSNDSTARRLMKLASNRALTHDLTEADAIAFSRKLWGNGGSGSPEDDDEQDEEYAATIEDGCTIETLEGLVAAGRRFTTIYADPPWLYGNQGTRGSTNNHYQGMTVEQVCALPVKQLAADDAQLHLWTTNGFLFEAPKVFEAWGFEFKSSFVWVKPQIGMGNYWRNSHEFLLTAIRGDAKRFKDKNLKSWAEFKRGEHSAKPEEVRKFLERASDDPRRLELFGRSSIPGWVVWGNEIKQTLFDKSLEGEAAA